MPTTVRAAGVGSSSLVSKIGGTLSTTVAALADIHPAIPTIIFATMAIISGAITIFVPETMGRKMPETIDDVERYYFQNLIFRLIIFLPVNHVVGRRHPQNQYKQRKNLG